MMLDVDSANDVGARVHRCDMGDKTWDLLVRNKHWLDQIVVPKPSTCNFIVFGLTWPHYVNI